MLINISKWNLKLLAIGYYTTTFTTKVKPVPKQNKLYPIQIKQHLI